MNSHGDSNRIYIHIGMDKTGTTYIQQTLKMNPTFLDRLGFSYLDFDKHRMDIFALGSGAIRRNDTTGWEWVKKQFENTDNIPIVSFEGLYHLDKSDWNIVQEILLPRKIHFIFYLRNHADMLASGIAQRVKQGNVKADYLNFETNDFASLDSPNYLGIANRLSDFPRESIHLRLYEKSSLYRDNILADFLKIMDVELNFESEPKLELPSQNPNPTLDIESVIILCELRRAGISDKSYFTIRDYLLKNGRDDGSTFIPQEALDTIQTRSLKANRLLANQWFNRDDLFLDQPKYRWRPLNLALIAKYYQEIEKYIALP